MDAPQTSVASAGSVIALAGIGSTALLEWLPKSAIVTIAILALTVAGFFVKRDYARLGDFMAASNKRQADIEAVLRTLVTVPEHRESITGVHRKVDALFDNLRNDSIDLHTRIVIIETKQGAHDVAKVTDKT